MRCRKCGATKYTFGKLQHHPACTEHPVRRAAVLSEHPDLIQWDADASYWYPDEAWPGPAPKLKQV